MQLQNIQPETVLLDWFTSATKLKASHPTNYIYQSEHWLGPTTIRLFYGYYGYWKLMVDFGLANN